MENYLDKLEEMNNSFSEKLDALVIQDRFISEIDYLMEENDISKKELAKMLNVTGSFITQVFKGKKFLNFLTLSKLQKIFDIEFKIESVSRHEIECDKYFFGSDSFTNMMVSNKSKVKIVEGLEFIEPEYELFLSKEEILSGENQPEDKAA